MSKEPSPHNIVILGASFSGIAVAHGILKAIPGLQSETQKTYKVTFIANASHFWWSIGAPRAMLKPYPTSNDDSFIPVTKGFEQYPSDRWEFVHAEITGLATDKREVYYKIKNDKEHVAEVVSNVHFDTLVIAVGSTGPDPLYSLHGSHVPTLEAYKDVQARLPSAQSVMVIGGGAAGTETAGELGHLHGKGTAEVKDITFISGSDRLLPHLRPAIGARAQEFLEDMGVKVEHKVRMTDHRKLADGKTEASLSDGSKRTIDLLLVATGRHPASGFLPKSLLNEKGFVNVDAFMRIPSVDSAYACGDIASNSPGDAITIQTQAPATSKNIIAELSSKGQPKEWKPMTTKETQIVPVGPNLGVGAIFGWWAPSFAVKMIKSKNFMFPNAIKTVMGTA